MVDGDTRSYVALDNIFSTVIIGELVVCDGDSSNFGMRWSGSLGDGDTGIGVFSCFSDISMIFFA